MPRHRLFTTRRGSDNDNPAFDSLTPFAGLIAGTEFRFLPSPRRKKWYLEWPAAFLLHAAIVVAALITFQPPMSMEASNQTPISIQVDNTGTQQNAAPPTQLHGPPITAQAPPSSSQPPPPPQQPTPQTPEMSLEIPQDLFSQDELPQPAPQPQQQQVQNTQPVHHYHPQHHYQVMTGMSLGNQTSTTAQPPMPPGFHGLNMQLSQSDQNAMEAPEFSVQGEIGSDWMSGFNKWVNAHIYYPQAAVENGQEGTSTIEFTVHRDGRVTGVHLLNSAGSPFLDQAWLGIFLHNNVPPFPPGTKSDTIKITASLEYQLIQ
jgi:protein TonB